MKKSGILLAAVVFLAIVWAGITYVVGNKAQGYYLSLLEESLHRISLLARNL